MDNLETSVAKLQAMGVQLGPLIDDKATRIAPFSDPDGFPLYFVQVKQGS